ncbi:MAG TPA: hypothetical protein VMC62_03485 [Longilinea sp.]|nr:hypothetical protein [Longilinea sp.]
MTTKLLEDLSNVEQLPMTFNLFRRHKPIRRDHAERYLLITLLSFAASVSLTRLFLSLTGYPQIGSGELHIAHLLWGGLLLFSGCLLPLIFANRWTLDISAFLGGAGVGLFIDEVGKFITRSNDYFYPSAAPIIYAVFLLTVLLYITIKRDSGHDLREEMYGVLEDLEEVVDSDLNADERDAMLLRLEEVKRASADADLTWLAQNLHRYLSNRNLQIVPETPSLWERIYAHWLSFERTWLTRSRFKTILIGGLLAWGLWSLVMPFSVLFLSHSAAQPQGFFLSLVSNQLVNNPSALSWFQACVGLEGAMGLLLLVAGTLLLMNKEQAGIALGRVILLISIAIVNLLVFYFDQFSTIVNAAIQFALIIGVMHYHHRFLRFRTLPNPITPPKSS